MPTSVAILVRITTKRQLALPGPRPRCDGCRPRRQARTHRDAGRIPVLRPLREKVLDSKPPFDIQEFRGTIYDPSLRR